MFGPILACAERLHFLGIHLRHPFPPVLLFIPPNTAITAAIAALPAVTTTTIAAVSPAVITAAMAALSAVTVAIIAAVIAVGKATAITAVVTAGETAVIINLSLFVGFLHYFE